MHFRRRAPIRRDLIVFCFIAMCALGCRDEHAPASDSGTDDADDSASAAMDASVLRTYDYAHDGTGIMWVALHGSGSSAPLAGAAPRHWVFPEGSVASDGSVSERRASVLYVAGGQFYRLDGRALGDAPPSPAIVSSLSDIADVCKGSVVSDMHDRAKSRLVPGHSARSTTSPRSRWARIDSCS